MNTIITFDILLLIFASLLIYDFVRSHITTYRWLRSYGTPIGAVITDVQRRVNRYSCHITATWTDPCTGRRWAFRGWLLDNNCQVGQLVSVRLDPQRPSHYLLED